MYIHVCLVAKLCPALTTPQTVVCQALLSMEFSRQEYWNGQRIPSPADFADPGMNQSLLHCRQILYQLSYQGSHRFKTLVFLVVMYGYENWTIKRAEHQRIDVFKLQCCIRLLGVSWTARRLNHSILKEINLEYSLEGLMLKLELQYSGHLM